MQNPAYARNDGLLSGKLAKIARLKAEHFIRQ